MKNKLFYIFAAIILSAGMFFLYRQVTKAEYISQGQIGETVPTEWNVLMANSINHKDIALYVDGVSVNTKKNNIYMDEAMTLMIPYTIISDTFDCAVNLYSRLNLVIERGTNKISLSVDSSEMNVNDGVYMLKSSPKFIGDMLYVPLESVIQGFGYTYTWDMAANQHISE